jgi:uncharacterized protein
VTYLLDVSALVALGVFEHEFHERLTTWVNSLDPEKIELATCPLSEIGFIRVVAQVPSYRLSISEAVDLVRRMKATSPLKFTFITDDHDCTHLPDWVNTPKQLPYGHLVGLAKGNGAVLATLDGKIRSAFLIPERT